MHFDWRDKAKNFSSPVGSLSPAVANEWYSSHKNNAERQCFSGCRSICGIRAIMARWKSCFNMVPIAFARPGFALTGKFKAHTFPSSIKAVNGGNGDP